MKNISKIIGLALMAPSLAQAAHLKVVTTVPDLAALVSEIGGSELNVESISRGNQDPHTIEAKPSFMLKLSQADLVVSIGLELEIGWLPSLLRGARNPKIAPGSPGNFEAGTAISVLEKVEGQVTRAQGDVHPDGNPHFMTDPIRVGQVAVAIAERLAALDAPHAVQYRSAALKLQRRLEAKTKTWSERIAKTGVKEVITYHKSLTYFLDRFKISNPAILEPKPGIPPTAPHIVEVTQLVREHKIRLAMVENLYDSAPALRVAKDVPELRVVSVPIAIGGEPNINTPDDLFERIVQLVEGKGEAK